MMSSILLSSLLLVFLFFHLSLSLSSKLSLPSRDQLSIQQIEKLTSIHENRYDLGAPTLNCSYIQICGFEVCAQVCEVGSLVIPTWLQEVMYSQIHLQDDVPLNWRTTLGTHNTYNALPYGYGLPQDYLDALVKAINPNWQVVIANQEVSMTDQLNIGIRFMELDVHWIADALRLCHAGGVHLEKFDELIEYLENITGQVIYFDSETLGCWNWSREFNLGLTEINNWLQVPENRNEFLVLYTDYQDDLLNWGKGPLVIGNYTEIFGDSIFTQQEWQALYPDGSWPTSHELIGMGKRVIICASDFGDQDPDNVLFDRDNCWQENSQSDTTGYPNCTESGYAPGPNTGLMSLVRDDALYYGPFWNGSDGGRLNASTIPPLAKCAFSFINPDELDPDTAAYVIWSWDQNQPAQIVDNVKYCTKLKGTGSVGRWATALCSEKHYSACLREGQNPYDHKAQWALSTSKTEWGSGSKVCPSGFTFEYPRNGWTNQNIVNLLTGVSDDVWLNVPYVPTP